MSIDKEFVRKLVADVLESIRVVEEYYSKPFDELSQAEKIGVRYHIIVLVEALTALAYHIARRLYGLEPTTPIQTFRFLADRGLVNSDELRDIEALIRLRNLLVHRYWVIDDRRIYENVKNDFRSVKRFVERLKNVLGV
ncbi:DUF86 domain-containing protein [Ignisphaera sp. 4213-co]|uniref:DUF86 domain-containing protein n=1 Tax=Ignisphaera cupida TaxID=3050454 RepID=A0ABD4Z5K6_9CREN|nr:DUF86 domain-containing protein [Ignisphaera sp. 4213-co]MDK6027918.1 DUF86 domain-containing protein [Ignisphaera sp. 4213-co]